MRDSPYDIVSDLADLDPTWDGGECVLCGAVPALHKRRPIQGDLARPLAHYPRCPWARAAEHKRAAI